MRRTQPYRVRSGGRLHRQYMLKTKNEKPFFIHSQSLRTEHKKDSTEVDRVLSPCLLPSFLRSALNTLTSDNGITLTGTEEA